MEKAIDRVYLLGRAVSHPHRVVAAILAGQLAGLAFLAWLCLAHGTVLEPRSWTWPLDVIGAQFFGEPHLGVSRWLWLPGLVVNQLGPALAWSLVYAWFAISPAFPGGLARCLLLGLGIGIAAQFVDGYFVAPLLGDFLQESNAWHRQIGWFWRWSAHVAWGLTLGFFFATLLPRIEGRRGWRTPG